METTQALETTQDQTLTTEQTVQAVYNFAANQLIHQHRAGDDVVEMLMEKGLDKEAATTIVNNLQDQIANAKKARARKDMLYGGLWLFGGIIVTVFTYSAASSGGGRYVVAWGAILFGGIQFFRGLFNLQ